MKRYLLRCIAVQCIVELLSCDANARLMRVPGGILTLQQQHQAEDVGAILGAILIFQAVCFFGLFYLLTALAKTTEDTKKLIEKEKNKK